MPIVRVQEAHSLPVAARRFVVIFFIPPCNTSHIHTFGRPCTILIHYTCRTSILHIAQQTCTYQDQFLERKTCTWIPFYPPPPWEGIAVPRQSLLPTHESVFPGSWPLVCLAASDAVHTHSLPFGTMSHAVALHALRNAPPTKPHPPWLQQLQAKWQATKQVFGGTRASDSGVASTSDSKHDSDKALKRKGSMQSLKEALHETKNALLAAIGLLSHKHPKKLDHSWLNKFLMVLIEQACKHHTDNPIQCQHGQCFGNQQWPHRRNAGL
jgi:hypothetical protein